MDESEFFTEHGKRFCFYLIYNIAAFVPIVWLKFTETEAQHQWQIIFELLLATGNILPFLIEGCYMRKAVRTYRDQRRTVRSFYLAPVLGFLMTLLVPHLYFWYVLIGPNPGLFAKANAAWSVTVIIAFTIDVAAFCYMGYQAH